MGKRYENHSCSTPRRLVRDRRRALTKWVTDWPHMEGLVSGDVGGGTFAGEVLDYDHTVATDTIEARYHLNGPWRQIDAHVLSRCASSATGPSDMAVKHAACHGSFQVVPEHTANALGRCCSNYSPALIPTILSRCRKPVQQPLTVVVTAVHMSRRWLSTTKRPPSAKSSPCV